jgi:hypothetical protein
VQSHIPRAHIRQRPQAGGRWRVLCFAWAWGGGEDGLVRRHSGSGCRSASLRHHNHKPDFTPELEAVLHIEARRGHTFSDALSDECRCRSMQAQPQGSVTVGLCPHGPLSPFRVNFRCLCVKLLEVSLAQFELPPRSNVPALFHAGKADTTVLRWSCTGGSAPLPLSLKRAVMVAHWWGYPRLDASTC